MTAASMCDFTDHNVKVYWLQEWVSIVESLPAQVAQTESDDTATKMIYARLTKFLEQTVRVSARCRTAFRKQKKPEGHEITSLCLN